MDAAKVAAKASTLEAELSSKSSNLADLEARVSQLEAENSRLRKAMAQTREAMGAGEKDPIFTQVGEGLGGNEHKSVEMMKEDVAYDVIDISDDEERMGSDVKKGGSAEKGVLPVPTPRKHAGRIVIGDSEDEGDNEYADGGGGSDKKSCCCDDDGEEEDFVSTTRQSKKRAGRVLTSDSEDEGGSGGGNGSFKDGEEDKVGVRPITTPSRKRALRVVMTDSENEDGNEDSGDDEDDRIPLCEVVKKIRQERLSEEANESAEMKEESSLPVRRSARLAKGQSKKKQAACRKLNYVEPKEDDEGKDDSGNEDDSMDGFINDSDCSENASASTEDVNNSGCSENASASSEESFSNPEVSDGEVNYKDVMACIGRCKRDAKNWNYEADMLSAFAEHPELCLKAVCALYRQQTSDEQSARATFVCNKRGFNQIDATRGSFIANFLLDGDPSGPLKKTVQDLEEYDRYAPEFCHKMAQRYSKQLFEIYQNKEDPYFLP